MGRSDLNAVEFWLTQALLHDLKAQSWPQSRDAPHWRAEARLFRRQASRRFTESMRQKINLATLYNKTPSPAFLRRQMVSRRRPCRPTAR